WTTDNLVEQVVDHAILIFKRTHPDKITLFMFDHSCNHSLFAKDILLVTQMSMRDSTKKPLLHNGVKPD
ncbi:5979_t:CDS:1, partial [Scutellospora calospora]